ncbi:MAG: lamin tail domain-containing protein, partial [Planctomycetota bacterium]
GYRVFHQASHFDNGSDPGSLVRFALDAEGNDLVRLSSGYGGLLTGYRQQQHLEAANSSVSLGRHFRSDGSIVFVPQSVNTPGQPNADPLVGPVVISEIMYHPKTGLSEYIELYNTSAEPVAMAGWKLGRYIAGYASSGPPLYSFPDDSTVVLPAGGRLVIAWDPDDLGDQYGRPPREVPVVGPYRYTLSNAGQRLALIAPGGTMAVDRVTYDDAGGWPREADGSGESLHRVDLTAYGDDAENWTSGPPTPGQ